MIVPIVVRSGTPGLPYAAGMGDQARGRERRGGDERAMGGLSGGGPSILGTGGSMRARDVSQPGPDHLGRAEKVVQVSYRPGAAGRGGNSPEAS